jgi:chromosome segregation ATPase
MFIPILFQTEALIASEAEKNARLSDQESQLKSARSSLSEKDAETKRMEAKVGDVGGRLKGERSRADKLEAAVRESEKEYKAVAEKLAAAEAEGKEQVQRN